MTLAECKKRIEDVRYSASQKVFEGAYDGEYELLKDALAACLAKAENADLMASLVLELVTEERERWY